MGQDLQGFDGVSVSFTQTRDGYCKGDVCVGDEGRLVKGLRKGRGGFV